MLQFGFVQIRADDTGVLYSWHAVGMGRRRRSMCSYVRRGGDRGPVQLAASSSVAPSSWSWIRLFPDRKRHRRAVAPWCGTGIRTPASPFLGMRSENVAISAVGIRLGLRIVCMTRYRGIVWWWWGPLHHVHKRVADGRLLDCVTARRQKKFVRYGRKGDLCESDMCHVYIQRQEQDAGARSALWAMQPRGSQAQVDGSAPFISLHSSQPPSWV
jgi:hypothetical protein